MTGTLVVPEGIDSTVVFWKVWRVLPVPYSNQTVTAEPFGFTVPFRFAPSLPMAVADEVLTAGGGGLVVIYVPATEDSMSGTAILNVFC